MTDNSSKRKTAESAFKKGVKYINDNDYINAVECLKSAYELCKEEPKYLSYYGLCIAFSEGNPQVGIELCSRAIKLDSYNVDYYVNLAKVYIKNKNRNQALSVLNDALKLDKENETVLREFSNIGQRKSPAISFLSRNNIINVYLGRLKSFLVKL